MNFLELKEQFENKVLNEFELIELHYVPHAFGSGIVSYRIKGRIVKITYDGKDNQIELFVSARHDNYLNASWTEIFNGNSSDFFENKFVKFNNLNG